MSSYFQRILRGAQSLWPATERAARDLIDWNAAMATLMSTGTANAGNYTLTLADGRVTAALNAAALGGGNTLKGWFKADTLALANNDPVSTWADASGNANNATQAGGARPVFKTGIQNGMPGVLFTSASSQFLAANGLASIQSGTNPAGTVIVVAKQGTGAENHYAAWGSSTDNDPFSVVGVTSANQYRWLRRNDDLSSTLSALSGAVVDTSAHVLSFRFDGSTGTVHKDGSSVASSSIAVGATTVNRFSLGALTRATSSGFLNGHLFEVLVYSMALSTGDRQTAERALGSKWGITVA